MADEPELTAPEGKLELSLHECLEQMLRYADSCEAMDNPERATGMRKSVEFIREFCPLAAEKILFVATGNTYNNRGFLGHWSWTWNHSRARGVWSKYAAGPNDRYVQATARLNGVKVFLRTEAGDERVELDPDYQPRPEREKDSAGEEGKV